MARLPSISARPPRRKVSSSSAATAVRQPTSAATPLTQVTKSAKRAAKRAALVQSAKEEQAEAEGEGKAKQRRDPLGLTPTISKSALRRRKRKLRDQEVLGKGALEEMKEDLEEVQDEMEDEGLFDEGDTVAVATSNSIKQVPSNSKVGAKLRKQVLAQESLRQPHILKDLYAHSSSSATNPFEAIRQHAQNTMAKPTATKRG